jgi:hypothetical protein
MCIYNVYICIYFHNEIEPNFKNNVDEQFLALTKMAFLPAIPKYNHKHWNKLRTSKRKAA